MGKKLDPWIYNAKLIKGVDGDTADAYIDCGFNIQVKKRIRFMGVDTWESRTRNLEEKKLGWDIDLKNISSYVQVIESYNDQSNEFKKYKRKKVIEHFATNVNFSSIVKENIYLFS